VATCGFAPGEEDVFFFEKKNQKLLLLRLYAGAWPSTYLALSRTEQEFNHDGTKNAKDFTNKENLLRFLRAILRVLRAVVVAFLCRRRSDLRG
jgi:hypothetical protein